MKLGPPEAGLEQRIWAFIERCYDRDFQVRLTPEIAADISELLERSERKRTAAAR